jgi:hypothetical protein
MNMKKSVLTAAVLGALTLGADSAMASQVVTGLIYTPSAGASSNFTFLNSNGYVVNSTGGTNDVSFTWDNTVFTASSDYTGPGSASNATISSPSGGFFTPLPWVAHDVQIFGPGTYTFDVALGGGNGETGTLTATVGPNQLGVHMLFDWNGNNNMDVFNVWDFNAVFGSGLGYTTQKTVTSGLLFSCGDTSSGGASLIKNCLWDGAVYGPAGKPAGNTLWMLTSIDGNGDGVMGIPLKAGGPFGGFNLNFNLKGTLVNMYSVTAVLGRGSYSFGTGAVQPTWFQIPAAPNVWIGTDWNTVASSVVTQAVGETGAAVQVLHQYDPETVMEQMTRIDVNDPSAQGLANRVWKITVLADGSDEMNVQLGNGQNFMTTSADQAATASKAMFRKRPVTCVGGIITTGVYSLYLQQVIQAPVCSNLKVN